MFHSSFGLRWLWTTDLFVYVDGVEGPLIILKADRGGCDCLIVLRTNNDDDQVFLLGEETT